MRRDPQISAGQIARWPMLLHHKDMPVAFLWTPKAGCTSLIKWFFFQIGVLDAALALHAFVHVYREQVFMKREGYFLEGLELMLAGEVPVIKLVRDPYARAVSSFAQVLKLHDHPKIDWPRKLRRRILDRLGEAAPESALSFHQFLRGVEAIGVASAKLNRHVGQQYYKGEEHIRSRAVRLENFTPEIAALEKEFGLKPALLEDLTASEHHRRKVAAVPGSLAGRMATAADFPPAATPSYDAFYDEETRCLAARVFAADFSAYDYPV
jgi:hypothetical protein